MKKWIAFSLCMAMLAGCAGCGTVSAADVQELTKKPCDVPPEGTEVSSEAAKALTDAAVKLLQSSPADDNLLLSPLSVFCAVGMLLNGAEGTTKAELENYFGMDAESLNHALSAFLRSQEDHEGLLAANSVWFNDADLKIEPDFLQKAADNYTAQIFAGKFDADTLGKINGWVNDRTDGMIPEILDLLPENAVMYLVNALSFRRAWLEPYTGNKVSDGSFFTEDGRELSVKMMSSKEYICLEGDNTVGFVKPYEDEKYGFAALLPQEGISLDEFVAGLDGAALYELLANSSVEEVNVKMPKFQAEYSTELSDVFRSLGVNEVFDPENADLSGIGSAEGNLFVSRILHKTAITVNETGTEAAAATAVEVMTKSMRPMRTKSIVLDRPYVYMIVDLETNIPVFIGTVTNP